MVITATQGDKKNEFGSYSTFVNVFRLKPGATAATPVPRRERSEEPMEVTLSKLLDQVREHPAYADRPASESDDADGSANTHLSALCKECKEKGWPTPEEATAEWLAYLQKGFKEEKPRASLQSWSEDDWGSVREALLDQKECPVAPAEKKGFSK